MCIYLRCAFRAVPIKLKWGGQNFTIVWCGRKQKNEKHHDLEEVSLGNMVRTGTKKTYSMVSGNKKNIGQHHFSRGALLDNMAFPR